MNNEERILNICSAALSDIITSHRDDAQQITGTAIGMITAIRAGSNEGQATASHGGGFGGGGV